MDIHKNGADAKAPGKGVALPQHVAVRVWLYTVAALILMMVVVGGATRLTGSGLSITEWQPILGAIPPLSDAGWQDAFHKYQQIPQFKIVNRSMTLSEFKGIYWWEWGHRFLGRFIGVVFLLPFLMFWWRGAIPRPLLPKLGGIFMLGGLQGVLGWYMVSSGLVDRVSVSQYRLTAHLGMAVIVMGAILWVAFDLGGKSRQTLATASTGLKMLPAVLIGLIYLQILAGGFVAGLDAGIGYNTWPLMDGALVPDGLGNMQPWYTNLFENGLTVQFDHRMLAYLIAVLALVNTFVTPGPFRASALVLLVAVIGQITLGIFTLLTYVRLDLALSHQAGAIIVFGIALYHFHHVRARA
ncbi:MAG: COX15/CtaA family protein [Alphaproteobacteria bacterium]